MENGYNPRHDERNFWHGTKLLIGTGVTLYLASKFFDWLGFFIHTLLR